MAAPVVAYLPLTSPSEPLVVYRGLIRRSADGRELSAPGAITLTWKRRPHLSWSVDLDTVDSHDDWRAWRYKPEDSAVRLLLAVDAMEAEVDAQFAGDGKGWLPGGSVGDGTAPLQRVVAHWINMPRALPSAGLHEHRADGSYTTWSGRWQAKINGWLATIDARPDHNQVYAGAVDAESFVITHMMEIRREDGATFTGDEVAEVLSGLQYAVSFAVGHWTCPAVPIGYGADGDVRWSEWYPLYADRPRRGAGWWADTRGEDLTELVTAYFEHWAEPAKREPLRFATTSAILAVETGFVEQRLQTSYSAIEMLSWVTEVLKGGMNEAKWRHHGSAWRVRRLLTRANVDIQLPRDTAGRPLSQFAREERQQDAPAALALIRDRLAHPKDPRDLYRPGGLVADASRLACHYLELVILHRINYRGHIADRTKLGRWIGDVEPAPWTA